MWDGKDLCTQSNVTQKTSKCKDSPKLNTKQWNKKTNISHKPGNKSIITFHTAMVTSPVPLDPLVSDKLYGWTLIAIRCQTDKNKRTAETCLRTSLRCINNRSTFCCKDSLHSCGFWSNVTTTRWCNTRLLHIIHHHLVKLVKLKIFSHSKSFCRLVTRQFHSTEGKLLLQRTLFYYFNHIHQTSL